ncbi:MAG: hypothetical protein AAF410_06825 [Pseudomonadota bacterium]
MKKIGIIAALPDEAACLTQHNLQQQKPVYISDEICICLSGIGHNNALHAAASLVKENCEALISWGVAGGLNESLHSGDVLIAENIIFENGQIECKAEWQEQLLIQLSSAEFRVVSGSLYSAAAICKTAKDKNKLHLKTGADAIDMESAAIAGLSKEMNLDFIAIRTIADEAVASIPPAVSRHTDSLGRPKLIRFIFSCLFNPGQILSLVLLARAFNKAIITMNNIAPDLKHKHFLYNTVV